MKFKIDNKIFEQYPSLTVGLVLAKGIDNSGESSDVLAKLTAQSSAIKDEYDLETLRDQPNIQAWREAYQIFGAKPKKYLCSVENLYRMILEGIQLRHINKTVDIYNYLSLKHMVPIGGDDLDKIDGGITLQFARGNEVFVQLNSDEVNHPREGEVVYVDDKEVLCRRWNWRECNKSKMTDQTKNVLLVIEGLPPVSRLDVESIAEELSELVQEFCGGEISTYILNERTKTAVI